MIEDGKEISRTPLLDGEGRLNASAPAAAAAIPLAEGTMSRAPPHIDEDWGASMAVATEAIPLAEGTSLERPPPLEETIPRFEVATLQVKSVGSDLGLSLRREEPPSLPPHPQARSPTKSEDEKSKEKSQLDLELGSADMCLVLVYAQWIWPAMVFAGLTNSYSDEERWFTSMLGNSLFLAGLWWIKAGAAPAATVDKKKFVRSEILPTVVWGILPPLSAFLLEYPKAIIMLTLAVLIPFLVLLLTRCKQDGCDATIELFFLCCSRCIARAAAPFGRSFPFTERTLFKQMEEAYFEDQKECEEEELVKLERQQEKLSYLEDLRTKNPSHFRNRWLIPVILIVLFVAAVCSLAYAYLYLISPYDPKYNYVARNGHRKPRVEYMQNPSLIKDLADVPGSQGQDKAAQDAAEKEANFGFTDKESNIVSQTSKVPVGVADTDDLLNVRNQHARDHVPNQRPNQNPHMNHASGIIKRATGEALVGAAYVADERGKLIGTSETLAMQ